MPQYLIKEECCGNCETCNKKHNKKHNKKRKIPYVPESERSKLSEGVDKK
jgi:hypothetical protein